MKIFTFFEKAAAALAEILPWPRRLPIPIEARPKESREKRSGREETVE